MQGQYFTLQKMNDPTDEANFWMVFIMLKSWEK